MNCKKTFSFLGEFSFFGRNFQDLGCQSTIKLKNNRRKNAPVDVFDQWFTIQNGFYVIYEQKLNGFCLQSKMADLSAYRDQQFRVIIFPLIFKFTLLNKLLFQGLTIFVLLTRILGHSRRVRKKVGNEFDIVRGKFVVLHNGRTDLRVILASWGPKKDHYGTR